MFASETITQAVVPVSTNLVAMNSSHTSRRPAWSNSAASFDEGQLQMEKYEGPTPDPSALKEHSAVESDTTENSHYKISHSILLLSKNALLTKHDYTNK